MDGEANGGGDVEEVLDQALGLGDEGRWQEMADLLSDGLRVAPDDPYLLAWLGVAETELDNEGMAYEYFRRCLAQDPLDPHLLALAGAGLAAFDDPDAEAALRAAALSGPDLPMARLQYGAYLARAGVFEEALEHLQAAKRLAPEDPSVLGELGIAFALKGDLPAAVRELESALELAPDDSWTRVLLGLIHVELDDLETGAELLLQAADEREDDVEALVLGALAAAALGWEDAAHGALARAELVLSGGDREVWEEAEERITTGPEAARAMLVETLGPLVLRDRLAQPL